MRPPSPEGRGRSHGVASTDIPFDRWSQRRLDTRAHKGMLRTFQDQPGFRKYGLADLGEKTCLSISLWETRKDAEASVPVAANWVRENIGDRVELRSTELGDLAFFEGALARV